VLTPGRFLRRLQSLFSAGRKDEELDEELQFHLEMETAKRMHAGMDASSAREAARRDFGGVSYHRDEARDARGVRSIEDFFQDLRVGIRTISQQRTYAIVAILTLAIGIGATTALWAAVYRVLLQPYPFREAHRIVTIRQYDTRTPGSHEEFSPANYLDVKARTRSLDMLAAAEPWGVDWIGPDGPESFEAALVTADAYAIQGLTPVLGRAFQADEFQAGRDNVVMFSEELWRNRFGADSSLVGRTIVLDSVPRVLIGIMPEEALRPYDSDVWLPKIFTPDDARSRTSAYWTTIGRLAPGVSLEQASAEMRGIAAQLSSEHPATNRNTGIEVVTLREAIAGGVRKNLLVLFGAVAFVLLIACVNVASLQLGESLRRRRELAIRTAIGAGRGRLIRQLLTESLLIAAVGALAGLAIAYWGITAIRTFAPEDLWQLERLHMDGAAIAFALALALASAGAVAFMPIVAAGRIQLAESLSAGSRSGSTDRARHRASRVLVVSEVALALVLLVGAGLLLRSLSTLLRVDRGFRTDNVLVATLQAWSYYPTPESRAEFVRQAVERLSSVPGVEKVGVTSSLPLSYPIGFERTRITVEGQPVAPGDEQPSVHVAATTAGYFEALDIRLERGRSFGATDVTGAPLVALVNRSFARRFFGDADPIGKRVSFGFISAPVPHEIVGVVGDVRHEGLHEAPVPSLFVPHAQGRTGAIHVVVRTAQDPALFERRMRAELTAMNGVMPLSQITTMESLLGRSLRERRFQLGLLSAFSFTALLLAAIGIYGVMSRATNERTHEIGVRMAVGAQADDVRWMMLRNAGTLAIVGIIAGLAIALLLTRFMSGMLFGVTPLDPFTYVGAMALLLVVAVVATWLPARRAAAVDPVVALKGD
jgi:putative ABC transport system permease protein